MQQGDPIQTTKLVASIDQVSNGRFPFGVGGGWNQDEMEDHGTVFETRFKLMRERIEAMQEIWTKSKAEYNGDMIDLLRGGPEMIQALSTGYRHPRESGGPGQPQWPWHPGFPAFAGMTINLLIFPHLFVVGL
jgi:alkanesulfonate monooxygenase SsuD/methylene tetrahydromethanopterin reductase-like flavin-dependent oxidoreductase (luciferase family)